MCEVYTNVHKHIENPSDNEETLYGYLLKILYSNEVGFKK